MGPPWKDYIKKGDLAGLQQWLDSGGTLDRDPNRDPAPLGYAANLGHLPIVKFLIERGDDPVESDAFLAAVIGGRYDTAKFLLPLETDSDQLREALGTLREYDGGEFLVPMIQQRIKDLKKQRKK